MIRGLREEVIGEGYTKPFSVSLHAVTVSLPSLVVQVVAVVNLPATTFEDVVSLRRSGVVADMGEHDALGAISCKPSVLWKALSEPSPASVAKFEEHTDTKNATHPWHWNSKCRIACCLWLVEEGLI